MWLVRVDAWVSATVLVALMVLAVEIGTRVGQRSAGRPGASSTRLDDATLGLFGLLLAFTFGAATAKHDRRLWLMVDEATAIGDLGGAAAVLQEPERSELKKELLAYLDLRIETARVADRGNEAALLERTRVVQEAITATTARAIDAKNTPSVHNALLSTLNSVTTAFENRRAALQDHVPVTILVMLLISAMLAAFSFGRVQGVNRARQPIPMAMFITLVGLAVYTTLDLEQPRGGIVRVPASALESVRAAMAR